MLVAKALITKLKSGCWHWQLKWRYSGTNYALLNDREYTTKHRCKQACARWSERCFIDAIEFKEWDEEGGAWKS